jgi:hypothetical protein
VSETTHRAWYQTRLVVSRTRTGSSAANYEPRLVGVHAVAEVDGEVAQTAVCGRLVTVDSEELGAAFQVVPGPVMDGCKVCGDRLGIETIQR